MYKRKQKEVAFLDHIGKVKKESDKQHHKTSPYHVSTIQRNPVNHYTTG